MCGIAGYVSSNDNRASEKIISSMVESIHHRGPDSNGTFCFENAALGHARLAIIDLSASASQPMHCEDKNFTIVYNGELYNYLEIKKELISLGYRFYSQSDTEVILNAYKEWGAKCVEMFNGMFAFTILNKRKRELFFARDRYGIKPLYHSYTSEGLIFASEIRAIESNPLYRFGINLNGIREYFTFQNFYSNQTLNQGIEMFPAGHFGSVKLDSVSPIKLTQYWDFSFEEPEIKIDREEVSEELSRLFQQAVSRQLVSDVELGSYLSGGMDSGSITAVASKEIPQMHTFTCGFDMSGATSSELGFDETDQAREFSAEFGTKHHEKIINASEMESVIPEVVKHIEEPRVGQSYPNFFAAQLAKSEVTVVLSGAGGDELFAGYPWRYKPVIGANNHEQFSSDYYNYWQRLVPEKQHQNFFSPIWSEVKNQQTRSHFDNIFTSSLSQSKNSIDYLNQCLYFEAKTFLHGLLVVEDKISMAHSLESRVPILDNDLVDFAMKIPAEYKLGGIFSEKSQVNQHKRDGDGKQIFRQAMTTHLSPSISGRVKQGFSAPDETWFRTQSSSFIKSKIMRPDSHIYNYFDKKIILDKLENHFSGKSNHRLLIWSLLSMEYWLESHM